MTVSLQRSSVRACSGQKTFTTLCEKHCFMPSFFFYPSWKQLVGTGVQFVRLPPFIRKLKMLPVYPGLDLFSFCRPEMGKEHIDCVSFHLMPLRICPNAPLFIYLFIPPLFLFPLHATGPEKEKRSLPDLRCMNI